MNTEIVNPTLPNSSIHLSGSARYAKADKEVPLHMHNEFELLTVFDGKTVFHLNGKDYVLTKGDIIFINSRIAHSTSIYKDASTFFIQFSPDIHSGDNTPYTGKYLFRFVNHENDAAVFKAGTPLNEEILRCMKNVFDEHINMEQSYDAFIKADVYKILALLYRNNIIKNPENVFSMRFISKILPALEYIDCHYQEDISLKDLCRIMSLNESYFCRLFKQATNTSFVQYLNFVRVCKAERMLISGDKSISEIAYDTGFSSVSYFNRTFKKYKFCAPSLFKKIQNN